MRKHAVCVCENKGADQLPGYRAADQHLCFRYIDSTVPLLSKPEISSLAEQPSSCWIWSENPKTGFHMLLLI